jgi:hypothetical protein
MAKPEWQDYLLDAGELAKDRLRPGPDEGRQSL